MTDVTAGDPVTGVEGPNLLDAVDEELTEGWPAEPVRGLRLGGEGGLPTLTERLMESTLEGEMTDYLDHDGQTRDHGLPLESWVLLRGMGGVG